MCIRDRRSEGLAIDGVPGEGYRLAPDDDSLTAAGVQALLDTDFVGRDMLVVPSLTSTNTVLKERYLHRPHGFTLLAEAQTGGRGRLGLSLIHISDRIPSAADTKTGSMTLPVFVFGCSQTFSATLAALPTRPRR